MAAILPVQKIFSDSLEIRGIPPFERIQILDFTGDRIVIRGLSGETIRVGVRRADRIQLDRSQSFSNAEVARARRDWDVALRSYSAALRDEPPGAIRDLILVRWIDALGLAGQFDLAVDQWIELLQRSPSLAAIAIPRNPHPPGSNANRTAREHLRTAITRLTASDPTGALAPARRFMLELLIFDEVDPLPAEYRPAAPTSQPLLFARPDRDQPRIELSDDSFIFEAARTAMQNRDVNRAVHLLEAAMPFCAADATDAQRLALAQARIEIGQFAAAINDLMPLVDVSNRDRAAVALYHVGLAHQRLGRPDTARRYYHLALDCPELPQTLREAARKALEKLGD